MNTQRHIIGRTVLELDTGRLADVWSLQEDMSSLLQQQGVREMARLFDELVGDGSVVRLDRVVVDIGSIDRRFLADEFIQALLAALRETLGDRLTDRLLGEAPAETVTKSRHAADWEVLLYFLSYGRLPWWCPYEHWQEWLPRWSVAMQNNTNWQAPLRELLKNDSVVGQRLIEQLPETFRHELILQFEPSWLNWHTLLGEARQLMQALGLAGDGVRYLERLAWLLLFEEIGADNAPNTPLPAASWISNWLAQLVDIWERTAAPLIVQNQPANADEIPSTQDNSQSLHSAIIATVTSGEQDIWLMALDQVLTNISENWAATDTTKAGLEQLHPQSVEIVNPQQFSSDVENLTPSPGSDWEILLYFLESGRWFEEQPRDDWQDRLSRWSAVMQSDTAWQVSLRSLLRNNSAARQRLVEQLPDNFRHELILQFEPSWLNWHTLLGEARQLMQALGLAGDGVRYLERQAWLLLFAEIGADNTPLTPLPAARWISNWLAQLVDIWVRTAASLIVQNQPVNAEEIPSTQDNSQFLVPNPGGLSEVVRVASRREAQSLVDAILAVVAREEQRLWLEVLDQVLTNAVYENISNLTPNSFPTREGEQESKPLSLEGRGLERGFLNKSHIELTTTSENLAATNTPGAEIVSQQRLQEGVTESFGADWEVLLYFLQSGRLPVGEISEDWLTLWSTVIQNETAWQLPLRQLLATNPTARRRLVAQFPSSWRHQLLLQLQPAWTSWYKLLAQARLLMQSLSLSNDCFSELENLAWELMLTEINADGSSLTPLPGAIWTRNWLAEVVQKWRWGGGREQGSRGAEGAEGENDQLREIAWQRLRGGIDAIGRGDRSLWLTAYNQVLNVTVQDKTTPSLQNIEDSQQGDGELLREFLQSGRLPGGQAAADLQSWFARWLAVIQGSTAWQIPLRELLSNNVAARQRFITQFPEALRHQLVLQLQPAWTNWHSLLAQAKQLMESLSLSNSICQELETQAWELLLLQISSDNTSLTPLPAATWTRNWLTQLVQNWRWGESWLRLRSASDGEERLDFPRRPGAGEERLDFPRRPGAGGESDELAGDVNLNQIAWERLRTSIDGVSRSQRGLWLNAYNQVLNVTTKGQQVGMPQLPQTPPQTDWQVLLYFLESGRLPDEAASTTWQAWLQRWETKSETETAQQIPLRQLLKNNVAARQRFITQLPEALRHQLVLQLQPAWTNWYTLLGQAKQIMLSSSLSNSSCQELETLAWELLLREISADNTSLTPLPAATWTSNWLTQLVQNWRWDESWLSEVEASDGEQRLDNAMRLGEGEQRLDNARQPGAGEQRLDSARQPGVGEEEIGKRNPRLHLRQLITTLPITETTLWLNALEVVVTATSPDEGNTPPSIPPDRKTTTPTEEPTRQQQPSAKQVEGGTPEITNPLSIPPRRARGSTLSTEEERAGVYVNIAGIVLLHPFLTFYLDAVGLLDGESFRDELAQQTAIYLLYYLATKQTDAPEYELVLPKLLCGWPLNEPVSRGLDLPTIALTEGENLLQTVINYWEVLKSTSRDGLREGFLQRAGKLTHGDGNWKLQVEQQAIDILLSRLPWGLSMVKLPWMEEILIVEWH